MIRRTWGSALPPRLWSLLLAVVVSLSTVGVARAQCVGPPGGGEWDNTDRNGDPPHLTIDVASCPDVNPAPGATVRYKVQSWWRRPNGTLATHPAAVAQVNGNVISARVQNGPNVDRMTVRPVTVGGRRFIDVNINRQNISGKPATTLNYRFAEGSRPDPNAIMLTSRNADVGPPTAPRTMTARNSIAFGAGDWDGDGHADFIVVNPNGDLMLYPGQGGRGSRSPQPVKIGNGWSGYTFFGMGDWDGDGKLDIVVRRDSTGELMLYPGEGRRAYSRQQPVKIGNGWNGFTFFGMADWDGDGKLDLIVRRDATGDLMLYPGEGQRAYSSQQPVKIGNGWGGFTPFGIGDWDGDGHPDILARSRTGDLMLYPGEGGRSYSNQPPVRIGNGWTGFTFFGLADWDGDGHLDILARNGGGELMLYPGEGTRAYSRQPPSRIATGL